MNKLPDISFERNMNHNYMILTKCDYFGNIVENNNDYRKKMFLENKIPGLLPVKHRLVNGQMRYYYMINSLQSLESLYSKREINFDELKHILNGCVKLFDSLEEYLLDGSQVILKPECIYMDEETLEMYFAYYPEYEENIREAFVEFIDMLLTKVDHTDNDAVLLSYRIYRYTKNPNYVISEIAHLVENHVYHTPQQQLEPEYSQTMQPQQVPLYENIQPYSDELENTYPEPEHDKKKTKKLCKKENNKADKKANKKNGNSLGIILCLVVALAAAAVILGDRMTGFVGLKGDAELYLYGVLAVAMAEMVVLVISRAKKNKARREQQLIQA